MPDRELTAAAKSGSLLKESELKKQFKRMLADPKSDRFIKEFTTQWLDLEAVNLVAIDPNNYAGFDDTLKAYMVQESQAFFEEILRKELSALKFLDSDFTMANALLAKHYGLKGPKSQRFERVALNGKRPGGLLGHGAFLMSGSDGAETDPIKRAVWIRERLLHDPPAPPPPLSDADLNNKALENLSVRERLKLHSEKAACADCHKNLDPWGIALESYNPIGLYRSTYISFVRF